MVNSAWVWVGKKFGVETSINICDDQSLDGRIDYNNSIGNLILFIAKTKIHHHMRMPWVVRLVGVCDKNKNFVSVAT